MVNEESNIRIHNLRPRWRGFPIESQPLVTPDYFPDCSRRFGHPPCPPPPQIGVPGAFCEGRTAPCPETPFQADCPTLAAFSKGFVLQGSVRVQTP